MGRRHRGRNRADPRCSKGSSGEAIPCQPEPLKRTHWARVALELEGYGSLSAPIDRRRIGSGSANVGVRSYARTRELRHRKTTCRPSSGIALARVANPASTLAQRSRPSGGILAPPWQPHGDCGQTHPGPPLPRPGWLLSGIPRPASPGGASRERRQRAARLHCAHEVTAITAAPISDTTVGQMLTGIVAAAMPWTAW